MYGASTPADACVAPMPTGRSSTISTDTPRLASSCAIAHPTIPAPTTMMSEGRLAIVPLLPPVRRVEAEVSEASVAEPVNPGVHGNGLSARPRLLDDRGLAHV